MQSLRQIGAGLLLGGLSVIMVLGGLSLSLAQGGLAQGSITPYTTGEVIATLQILPFSFTNTPQSNVFLATASYTPPPTLVNCPPPAGWLPIIIQPNDTLDSLAETYNSTAEALQTGNCLLTPELIANSILYVPPQPISTIKPCGAPLGWDSTYTVNPGDTLYAISLRYQVTWQELMQANCLDTSYIKTGQVLKVPNTTPISTATTSVDTPIPTATETETPESTFTVSIPTAETETETPTVLTEVPTPTETETPSATPELPSPTPIPSETLIPSEAATPTP